MSAPLNEEELKAEEPNVFYHSLSALEKTYWDKLAEVFALVNPQKPQRGIQALIVRARKTSITNNMALALTLETVLQGATERTHRRLALLSQCSLSGNNQALSNQNTL